MIFRGIIADGGRDDGKTFGYFRDRKSVDEFMLMGKVNPATVKVIIYGNSADPAEVIPDVHAAWQYLFLRGYTVGIDRIEPDLDDAYAQLRVCGKAWNLYRGFFPTEVPFVLAEEGVTWRPEFKIHGATKELYCDGAAPACGFAPYGPWLTFDSIEIAQRFGMHFIGLFSQWMQLGRARKYGV